MGLIKRMTERRAKHKEKIKLKNDLKNFLDSTLPCANIVKLTDGFNHIYVLLEYSPTTLEMLLNTKLNFACRFKILTGFNSGKVYDVGRYNSVKDTCRFGFDSNGRLVISALGYDNRNEKHIATKKNMLQEEFGKTITIRQFLQLDKVGHMQQAVVSMKNPADRNRVKVLFESEDIFFKEKYVDHSSQATKEY